MSTLQKGGEDSKPKGPARTVGSSVCASQLRESECALGHSRET